MSENAPASPHPLDHPARTDDCDRGKVVMGYEGYRVPIWVILPWIVFIMWGLTYLILYLRPVALASPPP